MNGVNIVGALLLADAELLALVPAARIKAGMLPDNVTLPALLVRSTSSVERQSLRRTTATRTTDRISVTVRASNYREQEAIIRRVKNCCAGKTGSIGGASSVAVLTAGKGPDVLGPATSFEQTQDFKVSYDAPSTPASSTNIVALPGGSSGGGSGGVIVGGASAIDSLDWAP